MTRPERIAAVMILMSSAATAAPADTTVASADAMARLLDEVQQLRAELDAMKGEGDSLARRRAEEMRALVGEVLADADTRASLLQSGLQAPLGQRVLPGERRR